MAADTTSTGRGGAGNIGKDDVVYTDAGIVREGVQGLPADGEYSSGRGGAGNIGLGDEIPPHHMKHHHHHEGAGRRTDEEVVPEPNFKEEHYNEFHTGIGGQGNVHKAKYGGHSTAKEQTEAEHGAGGISGKIKHVLQFGKDGK